MKTRPYSGAAARLLALVTALLLCLSVGSREAAALPAAFEPGSASPTAEPSPSPVPASPDPSPAPTPIAGEVLTDEDGDGIIDYRFHYKGATVYALIVLDPSRVFVGTALPEPSYWGNGLTLDQMAEQYGAVAGINGGGFQDEDGGGNGWPPSGITFSRGISFSDEQIAPIAGLDGSNRMWSGNYDHEDCELTGIRDAVCFGPALVSDGERSDPEDLESGIGARTLIGQREDGAIVMVVIDGRQGYSIGVTFADCVAIMADKFGCVNASNMDGGNSTCMYYRGEAVNRSANQAGGTRYLPDAWLVHPLPEHYVKPESVPDSIVLPQNLPDERRDYVGAWDPETSESLYEFVSVFLEAYYGYFGTQSTDYYYPTLLQYVAQDCELRDRANLALLDRVWVNTWRTDVSNIVLKRVLVNADGSYDILVSSDIFEQANYWSYEAPGTELRITVVEAPESYYGYLVTATY